MPGQLRQGAQCIYVEEIPRLRVPQITTGTGLLIIPFGQQFADAVEDVLQREVLRVAAEKSEGLRLLITQAREWAPQRDQEEFAPLYRQTRDPFSGLHYCECFPPLVQRREDSIDFLPVRIALLALLVQSEVRGLRASESVLARIVRDSRAGVIGSWRECLSELLYAVERRPLAETASRVGLSTRGALLVRQGLAHFASGPDRRPAVGEVGKQERVLGESWSTPPPATADRYRPSLRLEWPPRQADLPLSDRVSRGTLVDPTEIVADEDGEDHSRWAAEGPEPDPQAVDAWYASQLHSLHCEGALLPDTERTLSVAETAELWAWLTGAFTPSMLPERALNLTALALSLVTSRDRRSCLRALQRFLLGGQAEPDEIVLTEDGSEWIARLPSEITFAQVPAESSGDYHPVIASINQPIPTPLNQRLLDLRKMAPLAAMTAERLEEVIPQIRAEMRQLPLRRTTESRITRVLPLALYSATGDLRVAQMLCGTALSASLAPLAYYATPIGQLRSWYVAALASVGIVAPDDRSRSDLHLVGAPRAAVKGESLIHAIAALYQRLSLKWQSPRDWIGRQNALTAWTLVVVAVTVGHRWTRHLLSLRRGQFVRWSLTQNQMCPLGLLVHQDKGAATGLYQRVSALPAPTVAQLSALWIGQQAVWDRQPRSLLKPLIGSLDGTATIWQWLEVGSEQRVFARPARWSDLFSLWPEWRLPRSNWRHWLASVEIASPWLPADRAQQLGHCIGGNPFDASDPDSPREFARRSDRPLTEALRRVGLDRLLGQPAAASYEWSVRVVSASGLLRQIKWSNSQIDQMGHRARSRLESQCDAVRPLVQERVNRALERELSQLPPKQFEVTPALVAAVLAEAASAGAVVERVVASTHLRERLTQLRLQDNRWSIPRVSVPQWIPVPVSPIRVETAAAYQWVGVAQRLGERLITGEHRAAALALLFVIHTGICQLNRLLEVLNRAASATTHPLNEQASLLNVPLGSEAEPVEGLAIPPEAAGILRAIGRLNMSWCESSLDVGLSALLGSAAQDLLDLPKGRPALAAVLSIVSLGRQLCVPGVRSAWERGEINSASLPAETCRGICRDRAEQSSESVTAGEFRTTSRSHDAPASSTETLRAASRILSKLQRRTVTRPQAEEGLRTLLSKVPADSWPGVALSWALSQVSDGLLARSTVVNYWRATLNSFRAALQGRSLRSLDQDGLEQLLRDVLLHYPPASETQRKLRWALRTLVPQLERACGVELGQPETGLISGNVAPARGYGASPAEIQWINSAVAHNAGLARRETSRRDQRQWAALELAFRVSSVAPIRVSEMAGLAMGDHLLLKDRLLLWIHPRTRRGLKTVASKRLLVCEFSPSELERIRELTETLSEGRAAAHHLLSPDRWGSIEEVRQLISGVFGLIAAAILPREAARFHLGRHDAARARLTQVLPESWKGSVRSLSPTDRYRQAQLTLLPPRLVWAYYSRQFGHGSTLSTLAYSNLVGLLWGPTGLRPLAPRTVSSVEGVTPVAVRQRRRRRASPRREATVELQPPALPLLRLPATPVQDRLIQLAELLIELRAGWSPARIARQRGLDYLLVEELAEQVLELAALMGLELPPPGRPGRRVAGNLLQVLKELNGSGAQPIHTDAGRRALRRQLRPRSLWRLAQIALTLAHRER